MDLQIETMSLITGINCVSSCDTFTKPNNLDTKQNSFYMFRAVSKGELLL
jgi:hypothetical protein